MVLAEPEKVLRKILAGMKKLYSAGLVHADLSPYNILVRLNETQTSEKKESGENKEKKEKSDNEKNNEKTFVEEPVFIDAGQAVVLEHPRAKEFLERDVKNILNFFKKLGVEKNGEEELKKIVGR